MSDWPLAGLVVQAPMAGHSTPQLAIEVSRAGGVGSLALGGLAAERAAEVFRLAHPKAGRPLVANFFCFPVVSFGLDQWRAWCEEFAEDYRSLGLEFPPMPPLQTGFTDEHCSILEELRPRQASFHFGFPSSLQVERLKRAGIELWATANSIQSATDLHERGADVLIAQGFEAGGHRSSDPSQAAPDLTTLELVAQLRSQFSLPLIAAGGIGSRKGVEMAINSGADAVQVGSAYLMTHEAQLNPLHLQALSSTRTTRLTRSLTGAWARVFECRGANRQVKALAAFPAGLAALAPVRAHHEALGSDAFSPLYCGTGPRPVVRLSAAQLTRQLARRQSA